VLRSEVQVDLNAISANVASLKAATQAALMAVVKADGYGHGLLPSARAALAGGADWLGVAVPEEALALRAAGITARTLTWLWSPQDSDLLPKALEADIDVAVSSLLALELVVASAAEVGRPARVHLKLDTGLSRNGATPQDWADLVTAAVRAQGQGALVAAGVWSHFAYADSPDHPTVARQLERFQDGLAVAAGLGFEPEVRHLANSAATLLLPQAHFDLVRPGVAIYGLSPVPERGSFGLVPAMTVRSHLAQVKRIAAGEGVSYGHEYHAAKPTTVALVPLGYADGVPRAATNVGPVSIGDRRYRVAGRVCMDQFVIDVGDDSVRPGDEVVLFGPGNNGEPTAQDWADALDTIHYEIVTRIGARVPRSYSSTAGAAR
jgi:alanine racemase